jgi:hypothetical protein
MSSQHKSTIAQGLLFKKGAKNGVLLRDLLSRPTTRVTFYKEGLLVNIQVRIGKGTLNGDVPITDLAGCVQITYQPPLCWAYLGNQGFLLHTLEHPIKFRETVSYGRPGPSMEALIALEEALPEALKTVVLQNKARTLALQAAPAMGFPFPKTQQSNSACGQ